MTKSVLSETERVQQQTNEEWLAEYEGTDNLSKPTLAKTINIQAKIEINNQTGFCKSVRNAGIASVRYAGDNLLITTNKSFTPELDGKIKQRIHELEEISEPDTGESLYAYTGYRTFVSKGSYLAVMFREVHTGAVGERYFNVDLKNKKGEYFKTGINGEFRIIGNTNRVQEGMFLKFWIDAVKQIPNDRLSQICRYMKSKLSGVVISCPDSVPHHGITKLKKLKYEGHIYQIL